MDLIWKPDTMVQKVFEAGNRSWDHDGTAVHANAGVGTVTARSLIMTGTQAGVTFRPPDTPQIAIGSVEYVATLGTNADTVVDSAIGVYVREAHQAKAYLQPGQQVVSRADRLGQILVDISACGIASRPSSSATSPAS